MFVRGTKEVIPPRDGKKVKGHLIHGRNTSVLALGKPSITPITKPKHALVVAP